MNKVAVIIPFYRDIITAYEKIALQQCELVLSGHSKIAIKPLGISLPEEARLVNFAGIENFEDDYFDGIAGYNRLMLSAEFYHRFLQYEYVLIYQMDAFVFKDELLYWCDQNFDYIGPPWIKKTYHKNLLGHAFKKIKQKLYARFNFYDNAVPNQYQFDNKVGNGGFSLRKVKKFYDLCLAMKPVIEFYIAQNTANYNEDVFWSIEVNREKRILNIADLETGLRFAFEVPPKKVSYYNKDNLPFGCHDWDKYLDFWRPILSFYGYKL